MDKKTAKFLAKKLGLSVEEAEHLNYRRTGRTTRLAFWTIERAMQDPGTPVTIRDHHPNRQSDELLARHILVILEKLDLKGFTLNFASLHLTYSLFDLRKKIFGIGWE